MAGEQWLEIARALGLSQYEARVYLTLLEFGDAGASEISRASKVPRGRVYGVLDALQSKGLLSITSTTPRRYRPTALSAFVDQRKRELQEKSQELDRTAATLARLPLRRRAAPIPTGDFLLFRKRGAVMAKIRTMLEGATREIVLTASEGWAIRTSKIFLGAIRDKAAEGVEIRSCVNITEANVEAVKSFQSYVRIRHHTLGNQVMTIAVVDGTQVLVCHWNPDDDSPFFGDDVAVWSDDPGVVDAFRAISLQAWDHGVDPELRFRELELGEQPGRTEFFMRVEDVNAALGAAVESASRDIWASTLNSQAEEQAKLYQSFFSGLPSASVGVRLLVCHDRGSLEAAKAIARLGVQVRVTRSPTLGRHLVIDRRQALSFLWPGSLFASSADDAGQRRRVGDILVSTTVRRAVDGIASAYQLEWDNATPLERVRRDHLRTGSSRM